MSTDQPRVAAGAPDGGRFDFKQGAEAGIHLVVLGADDVAALFDDEATTPGDTRDWGHVGLEVGARTPWGEAQNVTHMAPGVASVDTASHGGIKLSGERNREVPRPLRRDNGWYEEDCEADIVVRTFPDVFVRPGASTAGVLASADNSVRRWFGREWAETTGNPVPEEVLAEEAERAARQADEAALRAATPDAPRIQVDTAIVDLSHLTPNQQRTVRKDFGTRWRDDDGTAKTLQNILANEGASGLEVGWSNGRHEYGVVQRDKETDSHRTVLPVAKVTYTTLSAHLPDTTSPRQAAHNAREAARHTRSALKRQISLEEGYARAGRGSSTHLRSLRERFEKAEQDVAAADAAWDAIDR